MGASASGGEVLELSLEQALAVGRERSFRLGRSNRNLEAAELRHRAAGTVFYPRFDSFAFLNQTFRNTANDQRHGFAGFANGAVNLNITQPIDIGGQLGRSVRQSELGKHNAQHDIVSSDLDVRLEIENAYYNALRVQSAVEIDEAFTAGLEKLYRASVQANSPNVGFLEVELSNARQFLVGSRTQLDLTLDNLKYALRLPPGATLRLTSGFGYQPQAFDEAQLYRAALERRPEFRQAELRIEQSRLSVVQVDDSRKPSLNVSVFSNNFVFGMNLSRAVDNPLFYDRGFGVTLFVPLAYYDWGAQRDNRRAAQTQVEQAMADLEEQKERLASELRQTLIALRRAEQRIQTLPSRSRAVEAIERAEKEYLSAAPAAAQAALAQMSNARNNLRNSETAAIEAYADYAQARVRLNRTIAENPSTPAQR